MPLDLGKDTIGFMSSAVSILASMSDGDLTPVVARAVGCVVGEPTAPMRILLRDREAAELLRVAGRGGRIAVMFSRPSTNRSIQVKGRVVSTGPADATDFETMSRYTTAMIAELGPLGFDEPFVRALLGTAGMTVFAVEIIPEALFDQTPGPSAGRPVAA